MRNHRPNSLILLAVALVVAATVVPQSALAIGSVTPTPPHTKPEPKPDPVPVVPPKKPTPTPEVPPTKPPTPEVLPTKPPTPTPTPEVPPVVDPTPTPTPTPTPEVPPETEPTPEEPQPVVDEAPSRQLRARIEPLFYMDYDFGSGIVAIENASNEKEGISNRLEFTRSASLYQKSSYEFLEGGIGGALSFYFANSSGVWAHNWAQVGLIPIKGSEIASVRYFDSLAQAQNTKGYRSAPLDSVILKKWRTGDNVTYKSKGGIIYLGGLGLSAAGFSATKLEQGTFETYVEKVSDRDAYVKITKSRLDANSKGAGAGLAAAGMNDFKNIDDGFSYLMNLETEEGRKVYSDLVRGNITAAQRYAAEVERNSKLSPMASPVTKVENFKRVSKGNGNSFFFGVPVVWNATSSENNIESFNTSDFYVDGAKLNAQFGIYDQTYHTRAFGTHTTATKSFSGVRYGVKSLETNDAIENGEFGRFTWVYQDDNSSTRVLHRNMEDLLNETGLEDLRITLPRTAADLDFTNMTLNITFSQENVQRLLNIGVGRSARQMKVWTDSRVQFAYRQKGNQLCKVIDEPGLMECKEKVTSETHLMTQQMLEALNKMRRARSANSAAYTKAFAEFGKAAMKNQVTLGMALAMAGAGAEIEFSLEGTYFKTNRINLLTTDVEGQFRIIDERQQERDGYIASTTKAQYKKSRYHGVITNKNATGLGAPVTP